MKKYPFAYLYPRKVGKKFSLYLVVYGRKNPIPLAADIPKKRLKDAMVAAELAYQAGRTFKCKTIGWESLEKKGHKLP